MLSMEAIGQMHMEPFAPVPQARTAEVSADLGAARSGALVQPDREAGAEVPRIRLALEQPSADARVQTPTQETVLSIKLRAIRQRQSDSCPEPEIALGPHGVASQAR